MIKLIRMGKATGGVAILLAFAHLLMASAMPINAVSSAPVLRAGTRVVLETVTSITGSNALLGQTVDLRLKQPLHVDGEVVIPAGSMARGQVTEVRKPSFFGRAGVVSLAVSTLVLPDGREVPLSMRTVANQGRERETLSIVLGIFVCFLFWFMKGEDGEVPMGTEVIAEVLTDVELGSGVQGS